MATFQSALGVKCEYCHSESAYGDDKLETKIVARGMLAMVMDLNNREFGGRQAVTCFTCHRGKSIPDR
jgi:photosynthetic reaction center cytochrome c subunit